MSGSAFDPWAFNTMAAVPAATAADSASALAAGANAAGYADPWAGNTLGNVGSPGGGTDWNKVAGALKGLGSSLKPAAGAGTEASKGASLVQAGIGGGRGPDLSNLVNALMQQRNQFFVGTGQKGGLLG